MGRSSRRMRRAAVRRTPEPTLREVAPGVYDVALPIPPGVTPNEVHAAFERSTRRCLPIWESS